jgi:hypothetical protein
VKWQFFIEDSGQPISGIFKSKKSSETSVMNNHYTLRNFTEERRPIYFAAEA